MILNNTESQTNVFSSGDLAQNNFKVIAGSKMFQVLSSKIYKNKIRAVVRELVCNCVDAHVLNGTKDKFEIKVPNALKPTFEVRDFGPGLSNEDMVELYTTYFASSKAQRNDQIGHFGLGSKSPFSYTDTFTTMSYFDGMISVFVATMVNGEPKLALTHQEPMGPEDKTGLHVMIPVRSDDFSKFIKEISYIMQPFDPTSYNILGCSNIDIKSYPEFDKYLVDAGQYGTAPGLWSCYGNILYPLDDVPGVKDASGWLRALSARAVIIKFDAGTIDIQPSREELSLDDVTIKTVVEEVSSVNQTLIDDTARQISKLSTIRECHRFIDKLGYTCAQSLLNAMIKSQCSCIVSPVLIRQELSKGNTRYSESVDALKHVTVRQLYQNRVSTSCKQLMLVAPRSESTYVRRNETTLAKLFPINRTSHTVFINDSKHSEAILKQLFSLNLVREYTLILHAAYGEEEIARQQKVISEIVPGEEVIYIRSSEHVEKFIEMRKAARKSQTERKAVYRPTSPNAYRYTLKDGSWTYKTLYLTASELDDLDTFALPTSFSDVALLNEDLTLVSNSSVSTIQNLIVSMYKEFEFIELRPASARRVAKGGKCTCLFEYLCHEVIKKWQAAGEKCIGTDNSYINENGLRLDDPSILVGNYTKDRADLVKTLDTFKTMHVSIPGKAELVHDLRTAISKSTEESNEIAQDLRKTFKKEYPALYEVLDSRYVSNEIIKDVNRIIKALSK